MGDSPPAQKAKHSGAWRGRLLASPKPGEHPPPVAVRAACGTVCHLPRSFFDECRTIASAAELTDGAESEPITLHPCTLDELALLLDTATRPPTRPPGTGPQAYPGPEAAREAVVVCRVANFLGHSKLRLGGLAVLTHAISGAASLQALDSLVGEADLLPAELQTAVATLIATPPSAAAIHEVAAAVAAVTGRPEGEGEGGGGAQAAPLQLCDTDAMFSLLAGLDIGACLRLAQKSHAACSMLFTDTSSFRFAFRAWAAVLQPPTQQDAGDDNQQQRQQMTMLDAAVAQEIDAISESAGAAQGGAVLPLPVADWAEQLTEIVQLVLELHAIQTPLGGGGGGGSQLAQQDWRKDADGPARRLAFVRAQAEHLGGTDVRRALIARVLVPQLETIVHTICTMITPGTSDSLPQAALDTFAAVVKGTAEAAAEVAASELASASGTAGGGAPDVEQKRRLDEAWIRCDRAHHLHRIVFGYLERFHIARLNLKPLAILCAEAKAAAAGTSHGRSGSNEGGAAAATAELSPWDVWTERGWSPPSSTEAPALDSDHKLRLISTGRDVFEVTVGVVAQCTSLKAMIDGWVATGGVPVDGCIPVQLESAVLAKALEFCTWHAKAQTDHLDDATVAAWNRKFVDVDQATLFQIILAANQLDIKPLLELTCRTVADMIKGKTPEEIRSHFNIQNDFSPEEEEEVRRENAWCEDI